MASSWEERRDMDERAPDSDKIVHAALMETLEAFDEATRCTVDLSVYAHWISHDEHGEQDGTYCLGCAQALIEKLDARDGWTHASDGDGWGLSGGYDPEHGPKCCDECGRTLRYVIDDSHAPDELRHFSSIEERILSEPGDVLAVHEIAHWAATLGPSRLEEVEEAAGIVARVDLGRFTELLPAAVEENRLQTAADWERERVREADRNAARLRAIAHEDAASRASIASSGLAMDALHPTRQA